MRQILERALPSNVDAERAILGAIILNNDAFYPVIQSLTEEDFYLNSHRVIFRAMVALKEANSAIDLFILQAWLLDAQRLEEAGGIGNLAGLCEGMPHDSNVVHYVRIVADKSILRQMIMHASSLTAQCFDQSAPTEEILASAEQGVFALTSKRVQGVLVPSSALYEPTRVLLQQLYEDRQMVTGVASGFIDLDRMTSGFQNGDLIIIAARPSMGKTALALNIAANAAMRRNLTVAMFSIEMSKQQLMLRMIAAEGLVDAHKLRTGYLSANEYALLNESLTAVAAAPIYIDDSSSLTVMDMRGKCRRLQAEHGLSLIIVDYLQLMASPHSENRTQEVSQISRGLKALAKEMGVPVIALAQLNRAAETRGDHKPQLSDLRDSGSIEQDADLVMFLYRQEVYEPDNEEHQGRADLIIGKARNGPIGSVRLAFLKQFTKFEGLLEVS